MKLGILFMLLGTMILAPPAHGRDLVIKRTIDGYSMSTVLTRNPPVLGRNDVKVEIKDASGRPVSNAVVSINYFMPPMPGMPPMNYTVPAPLKGSEYTATMDLIMRGPWNIIVKGIVAGKLLRMTVVIDVR
ncbi:MAG: hypothetical protein A4E57_00171 [Syntrophorhabdaceae bacterium PtaU1.Bin034]|jgi:hypothetical protein|nr:MAG: hypothetical protein A4E57_00171 [Syntrophorhabdaceae bacterium PtaU1.Bin034]